MAKILLPFILLFTFSNLNAQENLKNKFDLGLSKVNDCDRNWVNAYNSAIFQQQEENGHSFLNILYQKGTNPTMSFILSRIIVFPKNIEQKKISVSFEAKGKTDLPVIVKVTSYNNNESELNIDSIQLKINTKWKNNKVTIQKGNISAIKISFNYQGNKNDTQTLNFRNISVKVDKNDITNSIIPPPSTDSTYMVFDTTNIKYLNKSELQFKNPITNVKNVKVIGLGEITHGSKDIKEARNLFVKDLINYHNCKLVLLEVPFDLALLMNLYVTNKLEPSGKENLKKNMNLTFSGIDEFEELLDWIKKYNHSTPKQVKIFGIDNAAKLDGIDYPLIDYLSSLFGSEFMSPYLPAFMRQDHEETLQQILTNPLIYNKLSNKDIIFFRYFIKSNLKNRDFHSLNINNKINNWNIDRDENMFKRVCFLDSLYIDKNEKIVILAHSWHLKKTPLITGLNSEKMLGNYLNCFYDDSYFSINFTFGTGSFLQDNCKSFLLTTDTIHKPRIHTLESYAYQSGLDFFYFPTNKLNAPPNEMLGISRYKLKSDYTDFGNLKNRYDAIVFLRNVIAVDRHGYNSFSASHLYARDKKKEYNKLIKKTESTPKDTIK